MDVLAAIFACSFHADHDLVRAIAYSNARRNPYAVLDVDASKAPGADPNSVLDAVSRLEAIRARKHRALLGLMLVPLEWGEFFGQPPRALFDPCVNVSAGTAMLEHFKFDCRAAPNKRACVLGRYEAAIGLRDFAEVVRLQLKHLPAAAARGVAASAPVFAPAATAWRSGRVFFGSRGNSTVFGGSTVSDSAFSGDRHR